MLYYSYLVENQHIKNAFCLFIPSLITVPVEHNITHKCSYPCICLMLQDVFFKRVGHLFIYIFNDHN